MQRKTVSMERKKWQTLSLKPAMKYTTRRKRMGSTRSRGRSLVVLATKYALSLYISAALSFDSIALSCGNAKTDVNTGKNPQNTAMKNSRPACVPCRNMIRLLVRRNFVQSSAHFVKKVWRTLRNGVKISLKYVLSSLGAIKILEENYVKYLKLRNFFGGMKLFKKIIVEVMNILN